VQSGYRDIADIIRICQMRIRVPDQWWGDYLAAIGAARIAEREIKALAADVGWDQLEDFETAWFNYSERRMIDAISALPPATVVRSSTHDPMPGTPTSGIEVRATVSVDPVAGFIAVDLTDNGDALPCGLNVSEACTRTASMIGVFNSIDPKVPRNAGSMRRILLKLRENGVVGIPHHPTSCSVATTNVADRITNAVQCAFAEMGDTLGQAEIGPVLPGTTAVISGSDPRRGGKRFVNQLFLAHTGGAGTPGQDAWLTMLHAGNAGMCYMDSVEIAEMLYPIRIHDKRIIADTEGAGEFIGAPSCAVEYGPVGCEMTVNFVSDGTLNPAKGVRGGGAGGPARQFRRRADQSLEPLPAVTSTVLAADERLLAFTCGGGGYGDPLRRDPAKVAADIAEGWITVERARAIYGQALDPASNTQATP
jgi:N-methylhydantoinase B